MDEEPMVENNPRGLPLSKDGEGLKRGTRVGEGAFREVAAYILDHPVGGHRSSDEVGFAGVPPTVMVRCLNGGFDHHEASGRAVKNSKIGFLQMLVKNYGSCEDMGPKAFPVEEVHKIYVLDTRLANTGRHAGNILVYKNGDGQIILVPIDHGYCLPENNELYYSVFNFASHFYFEMDEHVGKRAVGESFTRRIGIAFRDQQLMDGFE